MEYFWFSLLLVGYFTVSVKAQAEAVLPDFYSFDVKEGEIVKQSDEVLNDDNVDESNAYNVDQVINSALAADFDEHETQNDPKVDGLNPHDEIIVQNEEILNSDEAKVKEEIESFRKELNGESEFNNDAIENEEDADGTLDDYQFEDNRSEEKKDSRKYLPSDSDGSFENLADVQEPLEEERNEFPDPIIQNQEIFKGNEDILPEIQEDTQVGPEHDDGENYKGMDEAVVIEDTAAKEHIAVSDDSDTDYGFDYEEIAPKESIFDDAIGAHKYDENFVKEDEAGEIPVEVYDEKQFDTQSDEDVEDFGTKDIVDKINADVEDTVDKVQADVEDTVARVQADLDKDLEHLFDTWNKLYQDSKEVPSKEEEIDVAEYEKMYGKPYGEDTVLAQRVNDNDYVNEEDQIADENSNVNENPAADISYNDGDILNEQSDVESNHPEIELDDAVIVGVSKLISAGDSDPENDGNAKEFEIADFVLNSNEKDEGRKIDQQSSETKVDNIPPIQSKPITGETDADAHVNKQNQNPEEPEQESEKNVNNEESKIGNIKNDNLSPLSEIEADIVSEKEQGQENKKRTLALNDAERRTDLESPTTIKDDTIVSFEVFNQNNQISEEIDFKIPINNKNPESEKPAMENETPKLEPIEIPKLNADEKEIDETVTETTTDIEIDEEATKSIKVSDLTSSQYDSLMKQFAIVHSAEMDPESEDFAAHVAPVHITLSLNEPTVVTSPNYPDTYPTNNIVDWIFDGEGVGIEFNVTDLELNGALGDYLLVKPGSLDESGAEGLIFSYKLTEPRQYRFLDVDTMFVRFRSNPAVEGMKGFSFSVKMVASTQVDEESLPNPEPLHPPHSTLTVYLGATLNEFQRIREPFRQLVADMATVYINTHGLDPGSNSTSEVTRVTAAAPCNVEWPSSRRCIKVTFGVPLTLETDVLMLSEDQLSDMWSTLVYIDPFAFRMRSLGLEEFAPPNEVAVLTSWMVIGIGAVISAAMLAFALWRYSCFEDYTKMSPFSDSDSIRAEKRDLDMYPTPHQTLPPLYTEEYHWDDDSTRVDLGGFTNRSFARDELFGGDSDDEGSVPTERYTSDV